MSRRPLKKKIVKLLKQSLERNEIPGSQEFNFAIKNDSVLNGLRKIYANEYFYRKQKINFT